MIRAASLIALVVVFAIPAQAADPVPRVQSAGDTTYFHISLPFPEGAAVRQSLRQAVEKIPLDDLRWQPTLVPQDAHTTAVVWRSVNTRALDFYGRVRGDGKATFALMVPIEEKDKRTWSSKPITVDFAKAVSVETPKEPRSPKRPPATDDLEGLWAASSVRDLAVRERVAAGWEYFRFARQALCRRYAIADPMGRPHAALAAKSNGDASIPVSQLPEIEAAEHPWGPLLAGRNPVIEPLAKFAPRDCYYLRVSDAARFESLAPKLVEWASSVAGWIDGNGRDYRLLERYQRQLLFPIDDAGRLRMPKFVHEFAVFGSDPHLRTGTDVTVVFRMSNAALFRAEMDVRIPGRVLHSDHRGADVESIVDDDRTISMYRSFVGGYAIYSNSPVAIRRALDAHAGVGPNLAGAPEFRLYRAATTDDVRDDVSLFASESFLRRQYGPVQVIAQRRRDEELQLLKVLQYAAIWIRQETGRPPADIGQLLAATGVKPDDPRVVRAKLTWDAGRQHVRSAGWNCVGFATPLLERQPEKVTAEQREAYIAFLDDARKTVVPVLAPAGLRLHFEKGSVRADVLAMPPGRAATWDIVRRRLGQGEVERPAAPPNYPLRLVASVAGEPTDQDSIKDRLIKFGADPKQFQKHPDWRGDRVSLHLDDGPGLAKAIEHFLADPSRPADGQADRLMLARLPVSITAEIRRPIVFVGWLNRVKEILMKTFPNVLTWEALPGMPRGAKVNRVQLNQATMLLVFGKLLQLQEAPAAFYAHNNRAVAIGLDAAALNNTVARELVGEDRPDRRRRRAADWVNAAVDVNPAAAPAAMAALRSVADRSAERRQAAAAEIRRVLDESGLVSADTADAGRVAAALRQFGFAPADVAKAVRRIDDWTGLAAELRVRPDGVLLSIKIEWKVK